MNLNTQTTTFPLTGLTCGNCVAHVQHAFAPLAAHAVVTLNPSQVQLTTPHASLTELQAALFGTKYGVSAPVNTLLQSQNIAPSWFATYRPLIILLAYILAASIGVQIAHGGSVTGLETMRYFMAGFFLAFSFFKFLDLSAFADAYAAYDLLAAKWKGWGMVYPFVELGLGLAYLTHWHPTFTHWATIIVMGFSALGVIRAVLNKQTIRCACLGSVFNLPMSTVTIVEDVGMVAMAAWMLL